MSYATVFEYFVIGWGAGFVFSLCMHFAAKWATGFPVIRWMSEPE